MKYYAVTDDPNELLHYGVKGMKWGQHIFGDKPRSAGYHRAVSKLRGITKTQKAANKRAKEQNKFNELVKKDQQAVKPSIIQRISKAHQDNKYRRQINRDIKREHQIEKNLEKMHQYSLESQANIVKQQTKHAKQALKIDKKFDKVLQQAREGRLRYGKLNDDQIRRVQDRLASEEMARRLGGREEASWRLRKKEARRAGRLKGIEQGTAVVATEIARAGAQYGIQHLLDRHKLNVASKYEGKRNRIKNRQQNKKTHRDIAKEVREEAFEERVRSGEGIISRNNPFEIREGKLIPIGLSRKTGTKASAKYLNAKNEEKERKAAQRRLEENNEQLNNALYSKIMLGSKNESPNTILDRFRNQHDDIYRDIYGRSYDDRVHSFDQPKPEEPKRSKITGAPKSKNAMINRMADRIASENTEDSVYKPLKYYVTPVSNTVKINTERVVGHISGKRRKRKDNPLKG